MVKVDYVQMGMLSASYFILNFEEMFHIDGRFLYDCSITFNGHKIDIESEYYLPEARDESVKFSFSLRPADVGSEIEGEGSYSLACSYAESIIDEYLRRFGHKKKRL